MSGTSSKLLEYLESQPGTFFTKLYRQPSTALAIFRRMLPHLAKTIVMSMLFLYHPLPDSDLDTWIKADFIGERDKALYLLDKMKILKSVTTPGKGLSYVLAKQFAESLRLALTGGGDHKSFGVPCNTEKDRIGVEQLDEFARSQWEGMLSYMVGSTGGMRTGSSAGVGESVKKLLKDGGLVSMSTRGPHITKDGFTFVLEDVNTQVWSMLVNYLIAAPQINMEPGDVLSFLFQLGSLELGQDYSKTNLTPTQIQMLEDLNDFGLIYQKAPSSKRFYPTRLATTLTSDAKGLLDSSVGFQKSATSAEGGFILIETNYRLYAFTTSELQIAIISLFSKLNSRYPNLVAGKITRQSVREAVSMGITSDQIISFLNTHAHAQMRKNNPVLPASVVDQIRLWQIEGERMKSTKGFLFKDFSSAHEYEEVCKYAEDVGVLRWRNDQKRMFFVNEVAQIAAFMRNKSKKGDKSATSAA